MARYKRFVNQIYSNFVMEIYIGMLKDVWNILYQDCPQTFPTNHTQSYTHLLDMSQPRPTN